MFAQSYHVNPITRQPSSDFLWSIGSDVRATEGDSLSAFRTTAYGQASTVFASTVSIDELRHPLSGKALGALQRARKMSLAGDHTQALLLVQQALVKFPDSALYSRSMLGEEYLFLNDYVSASRELEEAVRLFPHVASTRSNFALSLAFLGRFERAEEQVRRALDLQHDSPQAHRILGLLLERKQRRTGVQP